jgi:hypothetical protein
VTLGRRFGPIFVGDRRCKRVQTNQDRSGEPSLKRLQLKAPNSRSGADWEVVQG